MTLGARQFQKRKENFSCGHCHSPVVGDGFTNHCPHCLWSRHVDVHPGDRKSTCHGMMRPVGLEVRTKESDVLHRCELCGFEKRNKIAQADDIDALIKLSADHG